MYVTADKSFTRTEKIAGISARNTTTEERRFRFESTVYIRRRRQSRNPNSSIPLVLRFFRQAAISRSGRLTDDTGRPSSVHVFVILRFTRISNVRDTQPTTFSLR